MGTLRFLLRAARPLIAGVVVFGSLGAAIHAGLVAVLNRALHAEPEARAALALGFVGLALAKAAVGYASGSLLHAQAQEAATELRRELIRKLLAVPYRRLEQVGTARLYAGLTHDLGTINAGLQSVPTAVRNAAILLGGASYLAYLHLPSLLAMLAVALPCVWLYRKLSSRALASWRAQRHEQDRLYGHYRALAEGARELKMNAQRRRDFLQRAVLETTESVLQHDIEGNSRVLLAQAVNAVLVLGMLGLLLLALPSTPSGLAHPELLTGFVVTTLYLLNPLTNLLRLLPTVSRVQIALARIDELGVMLQARREVEQPRDQPALTHFDTIELRAVRYAYADDDTRHDTRHASGFTLGPLSLCIRPGELVFIAGRNGSGKSTLARVLAGLYGPSGGELLWDGKAVTDDTRDRYRQLWSCVLSEFHLFDRLYGLDLPAQPERAQALLHELELEGVVRLEHDRLSTTDVSRGQRKRLALFVALLEDRPLYLFDEWAADQDPEFKEIFYRELLPELQRRGKAVVVVTHDDQYLTQARCVLTLQEGKLVERAIESTRSPKPGHLTIVGGRFRRSTGSGGRE